MLRFSLTADQLGRMRFAVSPMAHLVSLLRCQRRGEPLPGWLQRSWAELDQRRAAPFLRVVPPVARYIPDLLTPLPSSAEPSIDDELGAVVRTDEQTLRRQLGYIYRFGPVHEGYAAAMGVTPRVADSWRVAPPTAVRVAYEREPEAFLAALAESARHVWDRVLAPRWAEIRAVARADVAFRAQQMTSAGLYRTVLGLGGVRGWNGDTVEIDTPDTADLTGWRGQIVLSPVVFLRDGPTTCPTGCDVLVAYPCRGRGEVVNHTRSGVDVLERRSVDGLAEVLGDTRYRLLHLLDEPRPGYALAEHLGVSAPTVSYHLARLRRGGLVERTRLGREVLYVRTAKAARLTAAAPATSG